MLDLYEYVNDHVERSNKINEDILDILKTFGKRIKSLEETINNDYPLLLADLIEKLDKDVPNL